MQAARASIRGATVRASSSSCAASLADIGEMLDLYDVGDGQAEQLRVTLAKARARLGELRQQRDDIEQVIGELEHGCRTLEEVLGHKRATIDAL